MGGVSDDIVIARALISRIAEPASIPVWKIVRRDGPVEAAQALRAGRSGKDLFAAEAARAARADPYADLDIAQRHGIRLVAPESDEWPHFAFAALEAAGLRRLEGYEQGARTHSDSGELIPPIALWVRGSVDLTAVGVRSVSIVGARAASEYGEWVARDLAGRLAARGFLVVSGGAHGIDAAAHRGALAAGEETVLVSAGGLDRPYPPGNATLFERIADSGLLISESPPGSDPRRRRFLTRNRLIAALGTGTLVVEAAERSGAMNTAGHCTGLGRPLMAVPGPVTSDRSAGCHKLIAREHDPARLVARVEDVLLAIGTAGELPDPNSSERPGEPALRAQLDALDPTARRVFDGFPSRRAIAAGELAVATGVSPLDVLRSLPVLELAGLVEETAGGFRIRR